MNFRYVLGLLMLISFFACKKDDDEKVVPPPDNFQPVTAYSSWTYAEFPGSNVFSVTMTPEIDTIHGKPWHKLFSTESGYYWFRKENGDYYWLFHLPPDTLEFLYLKDNVGVGSTWEFNHVYGGTDRKFFYTVVEKDTKRLINGFIYDHTITVKQEIFADLGGSSYTLMSTEHHTFAHDVGSVMTDQGDNKIYLAHYQISE